MKNKLINFGNTISAHLGWPQTILLLLIRLVWGWGFFEAGKGKLMHLQRTSDFFGSLGIPFPTVNTVLAASTETVGGLLLLFGLFSRLTTLPLIFTMIIAYLTAEHAALNALFTSDYMKFFEAAPWPFLFACLIVLLFGPGRLSLDAFVLRQRKP